MNQRSKLDYCVICGKAVPPGPDRGFVNDGGVLHESCRNQRDENAAGAALHMAAKHDKKAALAVDDMLRVPLMVERVERIATDLRLSFETEKTDVGTHVRFERGEVYVFAADKLVPPNRRPN